MQEAIRREFMYLVNKMLVYHKQQHYSDNSAEIDVGGRS
jgi:hypothetical protein